VSQLNVDTIKKADGTGNLSVPAETGTVVTTASPSLGRRNMILNGSMAVAQRGTSSTTSGIQTVDRWSSNGSSGSITQTQETLSSGDPYDVGFRNFFRMTNTDVVTDSTTGYRFNATILEAQDLANSGWNYTSSSSYVTFSFWVRSSVAQTYYAYLRTFDGTGSNYVIPFTLSANTWTKVTETISGDSALQFDNDNGQGVQVLISAYWGTGYTDSSVATNQWKTFSSSARTPDMTSTWADTDEATFDITGVQLEVGSVATPFEHRSYGEELAACQRYYTKVTVDSANDSFCVGLCDAAGNATGDVFFPTTMRVAPTALEQTGTASDYEIRKAGSTITCNVVPDYIRASQFQSTVSFNALGLTAGQAALLRAATTSAYLAWSAEL